MRELYEMAVDDLRQTLAQAADEYCRAEEAALQEVAAAVEHWLSDVWRRMPCNEWRQEWNALVDDFQARGINLIEPSTTDIGRLLETWNQWHLDRQERKTTPHETSPFAGKQVTTSIHSMAATQSKDTDGSQGVTQPRSPFQLLRRGSPRRPDEQSVFHNTAAPSDEPGFGTPIHGNDGYWYEGPNPDSARDAGFRGNGWWHSTKSGTKPILFVKGVPKFAASRAVVRYGTAEGDVWQVEIDAHGTRKLDQDAANEAAEALAKSRGVAYPGQSALRGKWHHADFKDGKFVMQLVETSSHDAARHFGGWADYLDWAAGQIRTGNWATISESQRLALFNSVLDREAAASLQRRVDQKLLDSLSDTLKRAGKEFQSKGTVASIKLGKQVHQAKWLKILTKAGKLVGVVLVVETAINAGQVFADTGDVSQVARTVGREVTNAELIEEGVVFIVSVGEQLVFSGTFDDWLNRGILKQADRLPGTRPQVEDYLKKPAPTIGEFEEKRKREGKPLPSLWDAIFNPLGSPNQGKKKSK